MHGEMYINGVSYGLRNIILHGGTQFADHPTGDYVALADGRYIVGNFEVRSEDNERNYIIQPTTRHESEAELNIWLDHSGMGSLVFRNGTFRPRGSSSAGEDTGDGTGSSPTDLRSRIIQQAQRLGDVVDLSTGVDQTKWPLLAITVIKGTAFIIPAKGGSRRAMPWPRPDLTREFGAFGLHSSVEVDLDTTEHVITGVQYDVSKLMNVQHDNGIGPMGDSAVPVQYPGYKLYAENVTSALLVVRTRGVVKSLGALLRDVSRKTAKVNYLGYALKTSPKDVLIDTSLLVPSQGSRYVNPVSGESEMIQEADDRDIIYVAKHSYNFQRVDNSTQSCFSEDTRFLRDDEGRTLAAINMGLDLPTDDSLAFLLILDALDEKYTIVNGVLSWQDRVVTIDKSGPLRTQVSDLSDRLTESQAALGACRTESAEKDAQISRLTDEVGTLQEDVRSKDNKIEQLRNQNSVKDAKNESLESENLKLSARVAACEREHSSLDDMRAELERLRQENASLRGSALEDEQALRLELANLRGELTQVRADKDNLVTEKLQLIDEKQRETARATLSEANAERLQAEVERLEERLRQRDEDHAETSGQLHDRIRGLVADNEGLTAENTDLRAQIANLTAAGAGASDQRGGSDTIQSDKNSGLHGGALALAAVGAAAFIFTKRNKRNAAEGVQVDAGQPGEQLEDGRGRPEEISGTTETVRIYKRND